MSREFAEAAWARYKASSTDFETTQFLAEQCAFMRNLDSVRLSDGPGEIDDRKENYSFEGMMPVKELPTSGVCNTMQELQRCKNGGAAVPTPNDKPYCEHQNKTFGSPWCPKYNAQIA